jgi:hypothetical protein
MSSSRKARPYLGHFPNRGVIHRDPALPRLLAHVDFVEGVSPEMNGGLERPKRKLPPSGTLSSYFTYYHGSRTHFRTRQAMSACSAGRECRNDHPNSTPRRPASLLRTHGSIMLRLRAHFWRTTGKSTRSYLITGNELLKIS